MTTQPSPAQSTPNDPSEFDGDTAHDAHTNKQSHVTEDDMPTPAGEVRELRELAEEEGGTVTPDVSSPEPKEV